MTEATTENTCTVSFICMDGDTFHTSVPAGRCVDLFEEAMDVLPNKDRNAYYMFAAVSSDSTPEDDKSSCVVNIRPWLYQTSCFLEDMDVYIVFNTHELAHALHTIEKQPTNIHKVGCLKNDKDVEEKYCFEIQVGRGIPEMYPGGTTNRDIIIQTFKRRTSSVWNDFKTLSFEMKNDPYVAEVAMTVNGWAAHFLSPGMRKNRRVALAAMSNSGYAIQFFSEDLKDDYEVALLAIKQSCSAYNCLSERLKKDPVIIDEYNKTRMRIDNKLIR